MGNYQFNNNIKDATGFTAKINAEFARALGLNPELGHNEELEYAKQNCILPVDDLIIKDDNGKEVWNLANYSFFKNGKTPNSVNPSLWINGRSNYQAGVFEVLKDKIYQVRGLDISNLTIIRGKTGWIVQDVMTSAETASAAIDLLEQALKEPVRDKISAIIISHSHADHFGGIAGVVRPEQVGKAEEGKIPVFVPAGFDEETVKENIFAGAACGRRSTFQFGEGLKPGPRGHISTGLGFFIPKGTMTFIRPTNYIDKSENVIIDGLTVEFQLTPGTEAPVEMNNYFADYRAFWVAENCNGTLHNLYPIRGAQLRDATAWVDYVLEAADKYADISDVIFQSHNWPHYNTAKNPNAIKEYLINNAAIYKYIHDQTLLYANTGHTAKDIARHLQIPEGLQKNWYARPYYGSVQINSRAVYTKYLGFYNGNPNDIDPLTEIESAKAFVEYAGGADKILERAVADYENGDYRKAAYAAGQIIFAGIENEQAKQLCADAFEQLGYVAESGIWRNAYLQGALELREGRSDVFGMKEKKNTSILEGVSAELILKYIGIALDYDKGESDRKDATIDLTVVDRDNSGNISKEVYRLRLKAGVLLTNKIEKATEEKYAVLPKQALLAILGKQLALVKPLIDTNSIEVLETIEAGISDLSAFGDFPLVLPHGFDA